MAPTQLTVKQTAEIAAAKAAMDAAWKQQQAAEAVLNAACKARFGGTWTTRPEIADGRGPKDIVALYEAYDAALEVWSKADFAHESAVAEAELDAAR